MDLDPTNPNLDGDYKAFLKLEDQREEEGDGIVSVINTDTGLYLQDSRPESAITDVTAFLTNPNDTGLLELRNTIFKYTKDGNLEKCTELVNILQNDNITLADPPMREESDKTALHYALELKQRDVASFYMARADYDLLTATFIVKSEKTESSKTCLHLLVEMNDLDLIENFLKLISKYQKKEEYMKLATMMVIPGQRPRHLAAIHLAALDGKTDVIRLLLKYHPESINMKNNKKDTPILWAARWNRISTVLKLLEFGANPNVPNDKGCTAFYWSVRYGYPKLASIILKHAKSEKERDAIVNYRRSFGFEVPIILASALGYVDVLKILLQNGADKNLRRAGGSTALHIAAMIGRPKVVDVLLDHDANKEAEDDLGNTALLIAVKNNHLGVAKELISNGADFNTVNKLGASIWDMAIDSPSSHMLVTILNMYRQLHSRGRRVSKVSQLTFKDGRSPLHAAAKKGDVDKIRVILSFGVNPDLRNQHGNTFLHIAARNSNMNVLREFIDSPGVDIDSQNVQGDTAMHLAAHEGNHNVVEELLTKSRINKLNNMRETVLHMCVHSPKSTPKIVETLVETIVKTQSWDVIDAVDEHGNTALHIAARNGRSDILKALSNLNPKLLNKDGESPLHIAASMGDEHVLRTMLSLFNNPQKENVWVVGFNIDMATSDGETMLHICAKKGNEALVNLLIRSGANLAIRDETGNTVLHDLVEQIVNCPTHTSSLINVFEIIVDNAAWWWCTLRLEYTPDVGSDLYMRKSRVAVRHLLEEIPNSTGHSVIQYATSLGATSVLDCVFSLENIYQFRERDRLRYDVTFLSPETLNVKREQVNKKNTRAPISSSAVCSSIHAELEMSGQNMSTVKENKGVFEVSCLDIVVGMKDDVVATSVLDVHPLSYLILDYWTAYRFIYLTLMVVHILNMAFFSVYSIPLAKEVWMKNGTNKNFDTNVVYGCLLIWPGIILLFAITYVVSGIVSHCSKQKKKVVPTITEREQGLFGLVHFLIEWIMSYISILAAFAFSILTIVWYILYSQKNRDQVYVLAASLILGWLYSIYFTKGFQTVHAFSIMLKYILIRDITRFLFIYSFVLLGFAFAMHALFQISTSLADPFPTPLRSIFTTFNMMIGMDEIFDESTDDNYSSVNSTSLYLRLTYLFYIILSTIVLLNLLIAMMSDTYKQIKRREGTTWRIGSIGMAVRIENTLPLLAKLLRALRNFHSKFPIIYDGEEKRFYITIPVEKVHTNASVVDCETTHAITKLESKLNLMNNQVLELNDRVGEILAALKNDNNNVPQTKWTKTARKVLRKLQRKISPF